MYRPERFGPTASKAENALKEALRDWTGPTDAELGPDTKITVLAERWLEELEEAAERGERSWGTVDTYRDRFKNWVRPAVGELRARELEQKPQRIDAVCQKARKEASADTARSVRSVFGNICIYCIRVGAMATNPMTGVGRIERSKKKRAKKRSLTNEQITELLKKLDNDKQAKEDDLPDLVRFFIGTGERTGEAIGAQWEDFDPEERQIAMSGNVFRARGWGLVRNEGKTDESAAPIPLPGWCVRMLLERQIRTGRTSGPIFPNRDGGVRDVHNTLAAWRRFRVRHGFESWLTFRTFRRTVATVLDEANVSARLIASHLRHSRPSMTQDAYMERRILSRATADALERLIADLEGQGGLDESGG